MKDAQLIMGDALDVLQTMPDESINCCVTSPPYYGLRDYGEDGQLGLEETPEEYIKNLVAVFREVRRVLRADGTLWLNIGDSYAGGAGRWGGNKNMSDKQSSNTGSLGQIKKAQKWKHDVIKRKDLIGIPWMLAFALRADGWYLRQDIIWYKPNCMPESVKDRCTKSHEYIFLLSKSEKYYFDYEAIKEPAVGFDKTQPRGSEGVIGQMNAGRRKGNAKTFRGGGAYTGNPAFDNSAETERESHGNAKNETGLRNKRSVWSVSTRGYKGAHFATFPEKLIEPCILAGCPKGGTVLDPFNGSGTTAVVSIKNGRKCIGIDINEAYITMSEERVAKIQEEEDEFDN